MTLYHPKTKVYFSVERALHSTAGNVFEGTCLITKMESGVGKVLASGGNAGEVFAGFALNYQKVPANGTKVELVTVPSSAPYTVTLAKTPLNPTTAVSMVTPAGTALTYNAGVASGQFSISGAVVTFNSAQAGVSYYATYRYTLTVDEAVYLFGDGQFIGNRQASDMSKSLGVIREGIVYTDFFDTAANWFAADIADLKSGASGQVVRGGSGATIPGYVVEAPSVDFPYLGLWVGG